MNVVTDKSEPLTAIHTQLGAIFVSLELSRSSWLITSLSPGGGERCQSILFLAAISPG
jgi:transposase